MVLFIFGIVGPKDDEITSFFGASYKWLKQCWWNV